MNKYAYAFIGLLTLLTACSEITKETPNGLKYTIIKAGDGGVPQKDSVLVFDYQLRDHKEHPFWKVWEKARKDSVWGETYTEGVPAATKIADSTQLPNEDGMTQMFRSLRVGDSVKTEMSVNDFFSKVVGAPAPPNVDTTISVIYTIKVRDIMTVEKYLVAREEQLKRREDRIFNKDTKDINQYLSDSKITALQDTSGLQYILHNNSGGEKPTADDCVEVKYKGRFLKDGVVFDQSEKVSFPLNGVIPGWKLGIPMLAKGDSGTFYIPSKLAYGQQGYPGAIPPDAILIFNVTLLDFKDEFDQATRTCK
jgi:FKBP-type peptidyl-prolyl cis-trans isomerase FkpA